jgi:hypothetical protein
VVYFPCPYSSLEIQATIITNSGRRGGYALKIGTELKSCLCISLLRVKVDMDSLKLCKPSLKQIKVNGNEAYLKSEIYLNIKIFNSILALNTPLHCKCQLVYAVDRNALRLLRE